MKRSRQNSTTANFGGRYTCPDCELDGAVDVRRVAQERWANEFPLEPMFFIHTAHRCTLGCAKTSSAGEQNLLRTKRFSTQIPTSSAQLRSLRWQPRLCSRSLGCFCGMPVCERTQCPLHGL